MKLKPTLFIGSSTEGLPIAKLAQKHLSDFADCTIWNEKGVFPSNENFLTSLNNALSLYEYGVLVATPEDKIISRDREMAASRDNVIFEFGLFMGRLGKHKAFLIKEKGIVPPSDLAGVSIPTYSDVNAPDIDQQIKICCETILDDIQSREGLFDGGIYPSIPLAYGYYHNSLFPACDKLKTDKIVRAKGKEMTLNSFKFKILIPDDLREDMKEKVKTRKTDHQWIHLEIPTATTRPYNFYIFEPDWGKPDLVIYDIPTTLNSLHQTIKEFIGTTGLGRSSKENIVEKREIRSFQRVVEYLVEESSRTKSLVETEIIDI
ncbi:MAG: STING domain-containing protein [Saprospiraceae bacterium]